MKTNSRICLAAVASAACLSPLAATGQVVINEFMFDDGSTDDREFVELYNAGTDPVDIGNWVLGGYDTTTTNPSTTIPAGSTIQPGGFFVVGNTGVLNLSHTVSANFLENDNEVIVLRDSSAALVDAVAYETNKGVAFVTTGTTAPADKADIALQVGPGVFSNSQGSDIAGTPLNATTSLGRFVDGRDTNNNGRDFGLRPSTPGTTNAPLGTLVGFSPADPDPLTLGTAMASMVGSFQPPRVIDPGIFDTNNPNVIPPPYGPGSKAYVMWDPSGGGNGATTGGTFSGTASGFAIRAFLDTTDLPVQFNATNVQFRGSEITIYGIGGGDALTNLTDLDGSVGLSAVALPAAESGNGFAGLAWVYERVGAHPTTSLISEKLYLVDANDGGDSNVGGNTPLDWTILATYDLSAATSGWHDLFISIDATGNGVAGFDGQLTTFASPGLNSSAFNIGYRENLQIGSDGTPDGLLRPATFTFLPIGPLAFAPSTPTARNLTLPATPGQQVGIQYSTNLESGSWIDIGNAAISGNVGVFSDTDPGRLASQRGFYRAVLR